MVAQSPCGSASVNPNGYAEALLIKFGPKLKSPFIRYHTLLVSNYPSRYSLSLCTSVCAFVYDLAAASLVPCLDSSNGNLQLI